MALINTCAFIEWNGYMSMLLFANVLFYFVSLYVCTVQNQLMCVPLYLCTDVYWPLPDSIIFLPLAIRIRTFSPLQKKKLNSFAGNMTIKKKLVFLGWEDRKSENNFPPIDDIFLVSRSLLVIFVLRKSLHIKEEKIKESLSIWFLVKLIYWGVWAG